MFPLSTDWISAIFLPVGVLISCTFPLLGGFRRGQWKAGVINSMSLTCSSTGGATGGDLPLILLDSDCAWIRSASEIAEAIRKHGAVTYELQGPAEERINGVSRIELAHFASRYTAAIASDAIPYSAGEFIAVSSEVAARISERAVSLWPDVLVQGEGAPREEAHLLLGDLCH